MLRVHSRTLLALLLVFAAVLGGVGTAPSAQADGKTDTSICINDLRRELPNLSTDVRKEMRPVVFVHGLWSDKSSFVEMEESLKTIGRLAGYRFDYKLTNDDWVTDGNTAQRLAKTIVCLSRLYGGKDVIIVAHSMGGLLTRAALDWAAYGTFAKKVTGHIVTIGTPHTGAPIARLGRDTLTNECNKAFVWWGQEAYENCATFIGTYAPAAMAIGSRELAALPKFPAGITVKAIAGEVRRQVCAPWSCSTPQSTGGDLLVQVDSATAEYTTGGAGDGKTVFTCEDPIAILKLSHPWCEHSEMLKSSKVQGEVAASIKAYLVATSESPARKTTKTLRLGSLALPARSTWKSLDDRLIIDTSTCEITSEGDFWKACARVFIDSDSSLKEVWNMLCADKRQSTTKSSVGGKAATLYKYSRCDTYESPGVAHLWHVPGVADIEYHLSGDGKPMAGIESALATATWK